MSTRLGGMWPTAHTGRTLLTTVDTESFVISRNLNFILTCSTCVTCLALFIIVFV